MSNIFTVSDCEFNALASLADKAKMYWFYSENSNRLTLSEETIKDLACALTCETVKGYLDSFGMSRFFVVLQYFLKTTGLDSFTSEEVVKGMEMWKNG